MAHRHIDGMIAVAQLKRNLVNGAVYRDVAIRNDDGDVRRIGTMMISTDMKPAMIPGSRGRFYVYDVLGTKGLYGFRPLGGPAHARFPRRWEMLGYGLGILNILLVIALFLLDGRISILSSLFGTVGIAMGVTFTGTRLAAMRAWHVDGESGASETDFRPVRA